MLENILPFVVSRKVDRLMRNQIFTSPLNTSFFKIFNYKEEKNNSKVEKTDRLK
jgi:hypothetical protein